MYVCPYMFYTQNSMAPLKKAISRPHDVVETSRLWKHVLALSPLGNFHVIVLMCSYLKQCV